jgi:hypothetical protein
MWHPVLPQGPAFQQNIIPRTILRSDLHKYIPNALSPKANQAAKRWALTHKVHYGVRSNAGVAEWISDAGNSTIWGGKEKKSFFNVTTYLTDCSEPEGMRVDHTGNLVVACTDSGDVNIYNSGNTTGPATIVYQEDQFTSTNSIYYYPADAFEDTHGNIYATNLYGFNCNSTSCTFYPGNIAYWAAGSPNLAYPSGYITDTNAYEMYFGDIDGQGNCYVDGFNNSFVPFVDELPGCASGTGTNLGITLNFPGGVYTVSPTNKKKQMLSVLDQGSYGSGNDVLYIYKLPYTGTPLYTDYPPQNINKTCDPVAGGFDKKEKHIKIGDAGCHDADYGAVATNAWTQVFSADFSEPIDAAFNPSDK